MSELKPCPFCGGPAEYDNSDHGYEWIACVDCGVRTIEYLMRRSSGQCYEAWNRRATPETQR